MISGAIDIGGTKIEARLFDAALATIDVRRTPTPTSDFAAFLEALAAQVAWLTTVTGNPALPIGIGLPGVTNPETGVSFAANVPISGHNVPRSLAERLGRTFVFGHDCQSFAYSEARGGAGEGFRTVVGLILGTGMAAGLCIDGCIPPRHNGLALEIGHLGVPRRTIERHDLPEWPCGCGNRGCFERYASGSGLGAIASLRLGYPTSAEAVARLAADGDPAGDAILEVWADITAEALLTLQLMLDPDCVVLGGGLSRMPGLIDRLEPAFRARLLRHTRMPALRLAHHGDSSGARGMALLAREAGALT